MRPWGLVGLIVAALIGCRPGTSVVQAPSEEPADEVVVSGLISTPEDALPTPGPTSPTYSPSPTPSETPYQAFAIDVRVSSDYLDLNVAPPPGEPETYRSTAQVSAFVTMSNGYHNQDVTWESSNPELATVDRFGIVRGVGTQSGTVQIIGYSRDRRASGSVSLSVTNLGDAEIEVN